VAVKAKPEQRKGNGVPPPPQRDEQVDLERGKDDSEEADDEVAADQGRRNRPGRPASPLSPTSARSVRSVVESPMASPGLDDVLSNSSREHSDATHATDAPLVRAQSRASSHRSHQQPPQSPRPVQNLAAHTSHRNNRPRVPSRRWRDGLSPSMELEEIYEKIPPQCRRFFTLLDKELERVTSFYADREAEAVERYEQLSYQWKELASASFSSSSSPFRAPLLHFLLLPSLRLKLHPSADHKKEFVAHRDGDCGQPGFVSNLLPKNAHLPNVPGSGLVRRAVAPRGKSRARRESDATTDDGAVATGREGGVRVQDPKWKHGRPEEYTNARAKLKLASASLVPPSFRQVELTFTLSSYSLRVLPLSRHAQELPCPQPYRLRQGPFPLFRPPRPSY
jgi:hypothetical protein